MMPTIQIHVEQMALVDLDVTFFVQLGVFLLFFLIMNFLVFRPLGRVLDGRRSATEGAEEEAEAARAEASELVAEYDARLGAAVREASELRSDLRREAQQEANVALAEARAKHTATVASEVQAAQGAFEATRASVPAASKELGAAIAKRLLDRGGSA